MCVPIALVLAILFAFGNSAAGQLAGNKVSTDDRTDVNVYRTLFRRDLLLNQLADEAEVAQKPTPYLRRVLATRFELKEADSESLHRLSVAYQHEIDPIHARALVVIGELRLRFPFGTIPPGADASPPPELAELQRQEDSVVLRYRDLLRNSMLEPSFQDFHAKVRQAFSGSAAH